MDNAIKKYIAFIPIRSGSKSIPDKNIKAINGKPLAAWTIQAAEATPEIDQVIVSTDSDEYVNILSSYSTDKTSFFKRCAKNATDEASTESAMLECFNKNVCENIILIQATSPLTKCHHLSKAISDYEHGNYDSLVTCSRIKRFFWSEQGEPSNYDYNNRPRRQDFKGTLCENGAFYISKHEQFIKNKNRLFGNILPFELPESFLTEIDEPSDWGTVENELKKQCGQMSPKIKLFITDVDGVLTDSGMYYDQEGNELKKFNTRDGKGLERLRNLGVKTSIITSENTKIVENRAEKLKIDFLYQGVTNKIESIKEICEQNHISLDEVAYIGDDLNCISAIENVGLSACPADATNEVKSKSQLILTKNGGQGCVREFAELIINTYN